MSTTPNKLAFKGTPGPWKIVKSQSGKHNINIIGTSLGSKYKVARVPFAYEEAGNDEFIHKLNSKSELEAEYDAHLISAAPEAVAFISDIIFALSNDGRYFFEPHEWVEKGEQILKKAYNF